MNDTLRGFCVLAVFCGAALRLAPPGNVQRIMNILVTAVLLLQLLHGFGEWDASFLGREMGRLHETEQRFQLEAASVQQRMDRLVIEDELRTYIRNKAEQKGLRLTGTDLEMQWQTEGCWLPYALSLQGTGTQQQVEALFGELEAELGVPRERQRWIEDEGLEG